VSLHPRIKSPLLTSSIRAIYQHLCASTLARYRQPPEADCRPLTGATAWYQDIRANMEQARNPAGLDQCGGDHPRHREERSQRSGVLVQKWLQRWTRSVMSPGSVTRRKGPRWTSRVPAVYFGRTDRVGDTDRRAAWTTGAGAAAMPVPYGHRFSNAVAGSDDMTRFSESPGSLVPAASAWTGC
jgi:hypothetical protein